MAADVHQLFERLERIGGQRPPVDPPSGGGDNGDMEARISKLEAIIPTLSTREDMVREVTGLRAEMHKEFTAQTWRIIGAMLTFGGLLSAAVFFIARYVK